MAETVQKLPMGPLLALSLANFVAGMTSLVVVGLLSGISADLGVSIAAAGQAVTAYSFTYAVSAPLLPLFMGRANRKLVVLTGVLILTAGSLLGALATNYLWMMLGRVLAGLGAALFSPLASGIAGTLAPADKRARAIGLVFAGLTVSTALGVPLGTLIGNFYGWRFTLFAIVGVGLVAFLAALAAIPGSVTTNQTKGATWIQVFRQPRLLLSVAVTLLFATGQFVLFTYVAPYLKKTMGLDGQGVTLLLLGYGVASVLGNAIAARLGDAIGSRVTILLALSGLGISQALLSAWPGNWIAVLPAMLLWGAAGWGVNVPQQARLYRLAPAFQGVLLPLNASLLYLGAAVGAALGGALSSVLPLEDFGYLAASFTLLSVVALWGTWGLERIGSPRG